jgi:hypothetical protein
MTMAAPTAMAESNKAALLNSIPPTAALRGTSELAAAPAPLVRELAAPPMAEVTVPAAPPAPLVNELAAPAAPLVTELAAAPAPLVAELAAPETVLSRTRQEQDGQFTLGRELRTRASPRLPVETTPSELVVRL